MRKFDRPGRSAVLATGAMCATSHPLAAQEALAVMRAGGNAVDGAIAGAVILGICEPAMTGLGGDLFALVSEPGKPVVALNASGRAPAGMTAEALRAEGHQTVPVKSAHAVTVPGAVDGFCALSERFGRKPLAELLAPAIRYAETGVPLAERAADDWQVEGDGLSAEAARRLTPEGGPRRGALFRDPGTAEVLRRIAAEGRDGFYAGEVAEDMVASLRALGGVHTLDDFAATSSDWGSPISGHYSGVDLLEHPPNGQGATAILILNILKHFDIAAMDPWGAERVHVEAEATKLAYDARNRIIADPDHTARLEFMLSEETAARLAALIRRDAVLPASLPGAEAVHKDTVYVTAVDENRMAVSLIYSIFHSFGSGLISDRFGILFQNRGAGFTLEPGHPNELGPRKRPMHTIIPAMLAEGGKVTASFGVMGGQYQSTGHARFVSNLRDFGLTPQEAIDGPRAFVENGELRVEESYGPAVRQALADLGHPVTDPPRPIGGAQAILLGEVLEGGSDPRKDGCAIGY